METHTEETILKDLIAILEDMTSDWDLDYSGGITGDTKLVENLAFESVEIIQLMAAIEQRFKVKDLPSEKLLMREGRYVQDLTVSEIAQFLNREFQTQ